jgi:predicted transcriptional regulator of viral defense system
MDYENVNDKINNLKQKGIIKSLKKGFYIHTSLSNENIVSKEIISNNLLDSPSYISLDYALSFYGLIPEAVHDITAVTTKRSKVFKTDIGVFSYKHIKKELFAIGIKTESSKNGNYLVASKEKAICDKIYFTKGIDLTSKSLMIEFIENDLRIDTDELANFNIKILSEYYQISKSKKIKILINIIKEI